MNNTTTRAKIICMSKVQPVRQAILRHIRIDRPVKIKPQWLAKVIKPVKRLYYELWAVSDCKRVSVIAVMAQIVVGL